MIGVAVSGAAGRMGATVCAAVEGAEDMELTGRADPQLGVALADVLDDADVVVDFSQPDTALANARQCLEAGVHCVVGTSGADFSELEGVGSANLFFGPNFAIGAVLMIEAAKLAAAHMPECEIIELHHDQKLDAPSGTAKHTAEVLAEAGANVHEPIHSVRLPGPRGPRGDHLRRGGPDADHPPRLDRPPVVHAGRAAGGPQGGGAGALAHRRARAPALDARFYAPEPLLRSARGTTNLMPDRSSSIERRLVVDQADALGVGHQGHLVQVRVVPALVGQDPEVARVVQPGAVADQGLLALLERADHDDRAVQVAGADQPAARARP